MIVKLNNGGLADGRYTDNHGRVWNVTRLIEHSKGLLVFEIPLAGIFIGEKVFRESKTARDIAEHVKRVDKDGNWWPRSIPGWVADTEFRAMFEIHPTPMNQPQ